MVWSKSRSLHPCFSSLSSFLELGKRRGIGNEAERICYIYFVWLLIKFVLRVRCSSCMLDYFIINKLLTELMLCVVFQTYS